MNETFKLILVIVGGSILIASILASIAVFFPTPKCYAYNYSCYFTTCSQFGCDEKTYVDCANPSAEKLEHHCINASEGK